MTEADALPEGQGDDIPEVGSLTCAECGTAFVHTGRGRKPKKCPDCRAVAGSSRTPKEDAAPKRARGIEALEKNIHQQLVMLGMGVAFFDTFDGTVIVKNAEKGAKALSNLAATNPKIRAALENTVEGAGYLPVAMWVFGTALPILAHHGVIKGVPDPANGPATGPGPLGAFRG